MTHGIGFLPQCDVIVVMSDGQITEVGSYTELIDNDGAFAQFLRSHKNMDNKEEDPGNQTNYSNITMNQKICVFMFRAVGYHIVLYTTFSRFIV